MSLKHGLLGLLNYGSMTGYDLDKAFKESLNFFWQSQTSQIYRELNAMEKLGWLTSEIIFQTDKPNKKMYSITPSGIEELQKWLADNSVSEGLSIRSVFLMKLFFSGEKSIAENIKMLHSFKNSCEKALASLGYTNSSINKYSDLIKEKEKAFYWKATANFGRYYYAMCIRWADDTIKDLEEI